MREINICPWCGREGDPIEIIMNKPTRWICECGGGRRWDINEDFECGGCGKELHGRFLYCSDECRDKVEKECDYNAENR